MFSKFLAAISRLGSFGGALGDRVVGVAFRGADTDETADQTDEHGVIPVSAVQLLLKTKTQSA
jgi:hypothetical protein